MGGKLLWSDADCFDSVNGSSMAPIKCGPSFSFIHFLGRQLQGKAGYHLKCFYTRAGKKLEIPEQYTFDILF